MICHVLLIFSVISSAVVIGEAATSTPYVPTDVFLVNCGGSSSSHDSTGRIWTVEDHKILLPNPTNASFSSDSGVTQVPFMTARIFRSIFTYSFPVTPGQKFVRLYFYPSNYGSKFDAVNSFFSVTVNGFTLLRNFSADLTVKCSTLEQAYLIKEFIVPVDQTLNLTFSPSWNSLGFVNGIEIVSMPDRIYTKGGFDGKIKGVDDYANPQYFTIGNTTALETVSRVNVGGQMITEGYSGMFRRWLDEQGFLLNIKSGTVKYMQPDIKTNYTEKTPAYVAPDSVYGTSRVMGNIGGAINLYFNLTWIFPVDAGFIYLVRLHFCEIDPNIHGTSQRVFSIFICNQMANPEMDVFYSSGGSNIPMYLDFSIYVKSGPLRVDLHPNAAYTRNYYNAILNGVEILKLNNSDGNLAGPNPNRPVLRDLTLDRVKPSTRNGKSKKVMKIGITFAFGILGKFLTKYRSNCVRPIFQYLIVVSVPLLGLVAVGLIIFKVMSLRLRRRKASHHRDSIKSLLQLKQYSYAEVKKITKSFSHIVGKGGFGTVYGGNLSDGRKVAVKILKDIKSSGEDFINEVASMSQTSHINIVSLLGFCYEGSKRAIVYEFLENGSLDQFISRNKSLSLSVDTLYGIALGVARGLEYLHYSCKTRIVHFDIKPQNVLLDNNLCPKISDFGLARLCEKRESILSLLDTRGTIGYIAPEVFSRVYGRVSHKSDVYSYGMLVLEMIGERNKETTASNSSSAYFPDWIYKGLENGEHTWKYGDEITKEEEEIAKKMILVSLWCIQPCSSDRPPMNRVVEMMEGSLDVLEVPPKPSFQISSMPLPESSSLLEGDSNNTEVLL